MRGRLENCKGQARINVVVTAKRFPRRTVGAVQGATNFQTPRPHTMQSAYKCRLSQPHRCVDYRTTIVSGIHAVIEAMHIAGAVIKSVHVRACARMNIIKCDDVDTHTRTHSSNSLDGVRAASRTVLEECVAHSALQFFLTLPAHHHIHLRRSSQ